MISISIPGYGDLNLSHLVLDVNGTLTTDGALRPSVYERLRALSELISVCLLTADTLGTAARLADTLGIAWHRIAPGCEAEEKRQYVESLEAQGVVAVGNGNNDALMLEAARLGIVVLGNEGAATRTVLAADVVVCKIDDALDLLLRSERLVATLRF